MMASGLVCLTPDWVGLSPGWWHSGGSRPWANGGGGELVLFCLPCHLPWVISYFLIKIRGNLGPLDPSPDLPLGRVEFLGETSLRAGSWLVHNWLGTFVPTFACFGLILTLRFLTLMKNYLHLLKMLLFLHLLHPNLPWLMKQHYEIELRSRTLGSVKPEISQAITWRAPHQWWSKGLSLYSPTDHRSFVSAQCSLLPKPRAVKSCPLC